MKLHQIINSFTEPLERFPRPFEKMLKHCRDLVGAEVGVFKGRHARSLVDNLHLKQLYLIDPFAPYNEVANAAHMAAVEQQAHNLVRDDRVKWIKDKSLSVKLENLDFVYIDGDHSYEAVKADIPHWFANVRHGGVLGGHDFHDKNPGVIRAVTEFAEANRLPLNTSPPDWWIFKP
jgi:hypothetical protein